MRVLEKVRRVGVLWPSMRLMIEYKQSEMSGGYVSTLQTNPVLVATRQEDGLHLLCEHGEEYLLKFSNGWTAE